jgi:glutamate synthase (NADPH) small chain
MDSKHLGKPDQSGRRHPRGNPRQGVQNAVFCSFISYRQRTGFFSTKKAGLKMGSHDSIAINDNYKTSMEGVFAAGDVTSGETLVVKAMELGREAAQRVHEYLTGLEDQHISFYERYYKQNLYDRMLEGKVDTDLPPD